MRGAAAGAALALPGGDVLAAVRERRTRRSFHCLAAADRFTLGRLLRDCSFAAFAPDGQRVALVTPHGIELYDRRDRTRAAITRPGFTLTAAAWHPDGATLVASGPAEDGSGPYLHAVDPAAGTATRLLPDHPGRARAGCFSPDGRKLAFTSLNGYVHQLALADWTGTAAASPMALIPFDPASEPFLEKLVNGLAWHETRGFSADGRRLYFASDRRSGMLNVNVHYLDLATGGRRRVTHDQGVVEGAVLARDDSTLYFAGTRAREAGFLTLVTAPSVPPVLGFVAEPTLHRTLAERFLAPVGNGDVLAVDETYGMGARMLARREAVVAQTGATLPDWLHRTLACSMSPDGRELAVSVQSSAASHVVLLRRPGRSVPPPAAVRATPVPKGARPLPVEPPGAMDRTVESDFGGRMRLQLDGELGAGRFSAELDAFNSDGTRAFTGAMTFETGGGGFRHTADVTRVNFDTTEDARTYYSADMRVDSPDTGGMLDGRSRIAATTAVWDGTTFAPQAPWRAGRRSPDPVPGSRPCRRPRTAG